MGERSHIIFEVIRRDPDLDSGLIRFNFRPLCVCVVCCVSPPSLFSLSVSLFVVMIMTVRVLRPRPTYKYVPVLFASDT